MEKTLKEQIDSNIGLKKQKNLLIAASLVLLVLNFSGAELVEANTFILKLGFRHQEGLNLLFLIGIIFLIIRYHNYSSKYHQMLKEAWTSKLLSNPSISAYPLHADEPIGMLHEKYPEWLDIQTCIHSSKMEHPENQVSCSFGYETSFPFKRFFTYTQHRDFFDEKSFERINIWSTLGKKKYKKILALELKIRTEEYFKNSEYLDINSPYLIGIFAIFSYFFDNETMQSLISVL